MISSNWHIFFPSFQEKSIISFAFTSLVCNWMFLLECSRCITHVFLCHIKTRAQIKVCSLFYLFSFFYVSNKRLMDCTGAFLNHPSLSFSLPFRLDLFDTTNDEKKTIAFGYLRFDLALFLLSIYITCPYDSTQYMFHTLVAFFSLMIMHLQQICPF